MRLLMLLFFSLVQTVIWAEDFSVEATVIDQTTLEWLKTHLQEQLASQNKLIQSLDQTNDSTSHCSGCETTTALLDETPSLYLFMSFALEDKLWLAYSRELEQIGGVFILRGLPHNSFKELADRIFALQVKGVNVPIQIYPQLFQKYAIEQVPSIVVAEEEKYDKIAGNMSLAWALSKMALRGETKQAKHLYHKWQEGKKS